MATADRPKKRAKLLLDENSADESEDIITFQDTDAKHAVNGFQINAEYAKRFEHNKKREEKGRLEEKYGKSTTGKHVRDEENGEEWEEDSEDEESEDDDAELATEDVDEAILATLQAIKNKDPRVYDQSVKFYREYDADADEGDGVEKKEKPMYLHDYHRRNLMAGHTSGEDEDMGEVEYMPRTYQQEQDELKRQLVGSMHATTTTNQDEEDAVSDDDFLVAKSKPKHEGLPTIHPSRQKHITDADVAAADKDPETYLSNFIASRAWLPNTDSKWQAFDSDDSEDEERAEAFEEAYNMRFEDPASANEKLKSFSRDVGKYSVRREDKSGGRKRAREREQGKKEAEKKEKKEEMARLKKLRVEEVEEQVRRVKDAAGLRGQETNIEDLTPVLQRLLEGDFEKWDEEMKSRFGEAYYAAREADVDDDEEEQSKVRGSKRRKVRKPKWDDDIDIKDLVPDFEEDDGTKPAFTLSSDEEDEDEGGVPLPPTIEEEEEDDVPNPEEGKREHKTKKDRQKEKAEAKRTARLERQQIEHLVDSTLPLTTQPTAGLFRYRDTSPTNFGLTARDILFAHDAQLNQYAGLKKMAAFRDAEKKRRDKRSFSKKARLRLWRKETFGGKHEPRGGFERVLGGEGDLEGGDGDGGKKKKRSRKGKKI